METKREASVSLVQREGLTLCVWNSNYHGWVLPGGKVEPGESVWCAARRELLEETSLETIDSKFIYGAPSIISETDIMKVYVFRVVAHGEAKTVEKDHPIAWMTWEVLITLSPFREFYIKMAKSIGMEGF